MMAEERRESGARAVGTPPFVTPSRREGVPSSLSSVLTFGRELRRLEEDKRKRFPCFSKALPPPLPDLEDDDDYKEASDLPLLLPKKKYRRKEKIPSEKLLQRRSIGDSNSILIESTAFIVAEGNSTTHQSDEDHTPREKENSPLIQFDPILLVPLRSSNTIIKPIPRRTLFPGAAVFRF
jgi:hypothetical protein